MLCDIVEIYLKNRKEGLKMITDRQENEHEFAFIYRLGEAKSSGTLKMTWKELAAIINKECRAQNEKPWDESAYRKQYQISKAYYNEVFSKWHAE